MRDNGHAGKLLRGTTRHGPSTVARSGQGRPSPPTSCIAARDDGDVDFAPGGLAARGTGARKVRL